LAATRVNAKAAMCEKWVKIDGRIAHLKGMTFRISDQQALDGIYKVLAELEAQKTELHPERKK
jgi:hypothetical protein